ncbi:MAG: hypothetical protein V7K38_27205 [Nostoc sp.]|uniref:hypothetical protein n=1 Tax=Nostoc sp. TaxID=1180 RepID=UPI002FF4DC31
MIASLRDAPPTFCFASLAMTIYLINLFSLGYSLAIAINLCLTADDMIAIALLA